MSTINLIELKNNYKGKYFFSNIEIVDVDFKPIIEREVFQIINFDAYTKIRNEVKTYHCEFTTSDLRDVKITEYSRQKLNEILSKIFIDVTNLI